MNIADNIAQIKKDIRDVCHACGRNPADVRLVAVSKKKPASAIEAAIAAGQTLIGESYVQECVAKIEEVKSFAEWHFIGGLQTNKVKYLCGKVSLIHSVDRLSLAKEINHQWAKINGRVDILIQVNLGGEESKSGVSPGRLMNLIQEVAKLEHVRIQGLMTLPPWCEDPEEVRPYFRQLKSLSEEAGQLHLNNVHMNELSMGMSHDYTVAIQEGATMIRIGTAIFGPR